MLPIYYYREVLSNAGKSNKMIDVSFEYVCMLCIKFLFKCYNSLKLLNSRNRNSKLELKNFI